MLEEDGGWGERGGLGKMLCLACALCGTSCMFFIKHVPDLSNKVSRLIIERP